MSDGPTSRDLDDLCPLCTLPLSHHGVAFTHGPVDPRAPWKDVPASGVYRVHRWRGGASAGHYGSLSFHRIDVDQDYGAMPHPADILDRDIADGTIIKVTVEVVTETPWPPEVSSWHDGKHVTHGHYGVDDRCRPPSYKKGDPWGCPDCHAAAGCCTP